MLKEIFGNLWTNAEVVWFNHFKMHEWHLWEPTFIFKYFPEEIWN